MRNFYAGFQKFILFSLLFLPFLLQAQEIKISGEVTDKMEKTPLTGVTVFIPEGSKGAYTDDEGKFELMVQRSDEIVVRFTYLGYDTVFISVKPVSGKTEYFIKSEMVAEGVMEEDVVITAGKYEQKLADVPISMEVIKPKQIELQTTSNIEDVLQQSPGVDVINGQLNIRGSSGFAYGVGSRVMIMLDGLPLLTADASFAQFDMIPTDNITQVEIMKGAASVLYGSSAMGGVVNVITGDAGREPKTSIRYRTSIYDKPRNASLDWDGSSAPYIMSINVNHTRKFKNNDVTGLVDYIRNTGYVANTSQHKFRTLWTFKFRPEKVPGLSYGFNTGFVVDSSGAYLYWANYLPGYDSTTHVNTKGGLTPDSAGTRRQLNTRWTIDPYIKYLNKKGNIFAYKGRLLRTQNTNNTNQSATNNMFYNDMQYVSRFLKKKIALVTGATVIYSNVVGDSLYGGHHYMVNAAGYFQMDSKFLKDKLTATAGARYEYIRYDDGYGASAPIARVGLNYNTFAGNNIRASFGQAFRAPSVAERFTNTTGGSLIVVPNPNLKVERGYSAEVGMRQGFKFGHNEKRMVFGFVDVAAFLMDFNNMIEFGVRKPDTFIIGPSINANFWAYNVTHARIRGGEITALISGNMKGVQWDISGGITLLDPHNLNPTPDSMQVYLGYNQTPSQRFAEVIKFISGEKQDNPSFLKYRNKVTVRAQGSVSYRKASLSCNFQLKDAMRHYDEFLNVAINGADYYHRTYGLGYKVFDFIFGYSFTERLKFSFNLENAFNQQYVVLPGILAEQRKFTSQIQYTF